MREIVLGQRPVPIQTVIVRLTDTLEFMLELPFFKTLNLCIGDIQALYQFLETLRHRVTLLSRSQDTITSNEFYKYVIFQVPEVQFSSEAVFRFLLEPLVDQLFGEYEPLFAKELKKLGMVELKSTRSRYLM